MNEDFTDIKQVLSELKDKDKYNRATALDKLANHPDAHEAISLLKNMIERDPIPFLRRLAICIYPDIDPENSYSVLIEALENEKHETVIREIALVLFSLKSISNLNIEKLLSSFKNYIVSKKYWILVFLRNKDSVSDEIIEELIFILKFDNSAKIRSNAALTLSYLDAKTVEDDISIESKMDRNKKYRFEYIYALIKLSEGDDKYLSQFEKKLYEMKISDIYLKDFYSLFIELNIKQKFEEIFKRYSEFNKKNLLITKSERKIKRKEKTQEEENKEISLAFRSVIETQKDILSNTLTSNVDLRASYNQLTKDYNELESNNNFLRQTLDIKDNFIDNLLKKRNLAILILADIGSLSASLLFNILTNRIGGLPFINIYLLITICLTPPIAIFVTIWIIQSCSLKKAKKNIM